MEAFSSNKKEVLANASGLTSHFDKENITPNVEVPSWTPKTKKSNQVRGDRKGSCNKPMTANGSHDRPEVISEDNTTSEAHIYEVNTKPYRTVVNTDGSFDIEPWGPSTICVLKLYRHEESGATQLVLRLPESGVLKLNLAIQNNVFYLGMHIPRQKKGLTKVGQISFCAREKDKVFERFVLKVNYENVKALYSKLLELGAIPQPLHKTLRDSQDTNSAVRMGAELALTVAKENNHVEFFVALAKELAKEGTGGSVRQLAGEHLKNLLFGKDDALQVKQHDRWKAISPSIRNEIKSTVLNAMRSPVCLARHTAMQVCSEIAAIELPYNEWPELPLVMHENVTSAEGGDGIKISSLECIGSTCSCIADLMSTSADTSGVSQEDTDQMLMTIVHGIRSKPDPIRVAAAKALSNSLSLVRECMEISTKRDMIIESICNATKDKDVGIRGAAYECIVQIASQYYDNLQSYMPTLFQLAFVTIRNDEEKVKLLAIELLSTLAEKEMELHIMAAELAKAGQGPPPEGVYVGYVKVALKDLVPVLTETLLKQDEEPNFDDNQWNISTGGATCLQLVSKTCEDDIIQHIMPFVQMHVKSENWRYKKAATMAFGSILEGPSSDVIRPHVNESIPILLTALSDANDLVKDTAMLTIGRICDLHVRSISDDNFVALVNYAAQDAKPVLLKLLPAIIERVDQSFNLTALTNEDKERREGVQGLLCGAILSYNMTKEELLPHFDVIMTKLLQVLKTKNATRHEEALKALSAIANILDEAFVKYMKGISCAIAREMKPYCNEIVRALVETVLSSSLHRSLKPPLLSCFGDIALAITSEYESYLETSVKMLLHAAQTRVPDEDDDLIDYVRKLRVGILEAFTGIFRGLADGNRTDLLLTYVDGVFSSLEMVASDRKNDYDNLVLAKAVGLVRDVTDSFGSRIKDQIQRTFVQQILHDGLATGDPDIVKNCTHAADQIAQILTPTVGGNTDQ